MKLFVREEDTITEMLCRRCFIFGVFLVWSKCFYGYPITSIKPKALQVPTETDELPNLTTQEMEEYLTKYHYLGKNCSDPEIRRLSKISKKKAFSKALGNFQKYAGLRVTRKKDRQTKRMMLSPRCGLPDDFVTQKSKHIRNRRYVTVPKDEIWDASKVITYQIKRFPPKTPRIDPGNNSTQLNTSASDPEIKSAVKRAFDDWANVSKLRFQEVQRNPDIELAFKKRYHNDGFPFDGPGKELGHGFRPRLGGDVHFDEAEVWTLSPDSQHGYNIYFVALHEIGHALGLLHAQSNTSVMYGFYSLSRRNFNLTQDDIDPSRHRSNS